MVNPRFEEAYWSGRESLRFVGKKCLLPPLGLITVAALLPKTWRCRLVDLNIETLSDKQMSDVDLVMLTGMLAQRASLHEEIARCRRLGLRSIVGGPYASALPDDFAAVDHLVIGEAEESLPRFASELEAGCATRVYRAARRPDLAIVPIPRYELLRRGAYHQLSLQFSRGCPYSCEFCDIVELFGRQPRVKGAAQVVAELEAIRRTGFRGDVFFVDDNFIGNRKAVRTVLPEIAAWRQRTRAKISFYTEASMNLADDPSLVDAMVAAGFTAVFLGIESPSREALQETGKHQNLTGDPVERVHELMSRGLDVWGGFILGFDSDGPDCFDQMIEFVQRASIPYAMVGLLGALPGTRLFQRLQREGRLRSTQIGDRGDQFGLTNVINKLSVEQMVNGYRRVMETLYDPDIYFQRCRRNLARWVSPRGAQPLPSWRELRAGWRALIAQGVRSRYRRAYWQFLAWAATRHPTKLARAMTLAAVGHHYIHYTRQTVVPALQRIGEPLS